MLFNSAVFFAFFALVYSVYLACGRRTSWQNGWLLLASYVFYGWWDWRFLSLIVLSTGVDYVLGNAMAATDDAAKRKRLVLTSVVTNLSILAFFKYAGFFVDSMATSLTALGVEANLPLLNIVLPVGISFYTFQTLSYTIDVYRGQLKPTRSLLNFALFVSFFPQLVAGPIERAAALLPQVERERHIDFAQVERGLNLVLWGLFKKVVLADNCARIADQVFNSGGEASGLSLIVGALAFTIQIYGDFSGYTDIARGISKMMGFELMLNFRIPYLAVSPSDFWRRWHISLSSWLRDYLYISLGGNRGGSLMTYRNLALTMLLGGLWHGASWNFVIWGAFHGAILVLYRITPGLNRDPKLDGTAKTALVWAARVALMFTLTVIGWVLFRCHTWEQIVWWFTNVGVGLSADTLVLARTVIACAIPLAAVQGLQAWTGDLDVMMRGNAFTRGLWWTLLLIGIGLFGVREAAEFIYFQF